jgi:hypothetical protein
MGEYLSKPDKNKDTEKGGSAEVRYVAVGMQGWRKSMEDSHISNVTDLGQGTSFFGVFDGEVSKTISFSVSKQIFFVFAG